MQKTDVGKVLFYNCSSLFLLLLLLLLCNAVANRRTQVGRREVCIPTESVDQ
jgi:hypothetical protein